MRLRTSKTSRRHHNRLQCQWLFFLALGTTATLFVTRQLLQVSQRNNEPVDGALFDVPVISKTSPQTITSDFYETDELCPYCRLRHDVSEYPLYCHERIAGRVASPFLRNVTIEDNLVELVEHNAYVRAAAAFTSDWKTRNDTDAKRLCSQCDPASCTLEDKRYYALDRVCLLYTSPSPRD